MSRVVTFTCDVTGRGGKGLVLDTEDGEEVAPPIGWFEVTIAKTVRNADLVDAIAEIQANELLSDEDKARGVDALRAEYPSTVREYATLHIHPDGITQLPEFMRGV